MLSAGGSSVMPIAPPSALMTAFTCSWTWSIAIGEKLRHDYNNYCVGPTTNAPCLVLAVFVHIVSESKILYHTQMS